MTEASGEDRNASRIRRRIGAQTARTLLGMRALGTSEGRAELAAAVSRETGRPLSTRDEDTVAEQLLDVFRHCAQDPDGLLVLAGVVHGMDPYGVQVSAVQRLADEWTAVGSLEGLAVLGSWRFLAEALSPLQPLPYPYKMRSALIWLATGQRLTEPPPHAENPWHDFLYLAGQNTAPGELPPWMFHLDVCAPYMSGEQSEEVMARNRHWSLGLGLSELLDEERNRVRGSSVSGVARQLRRYLAIRIETDPLNNTRYNVFPSHMSDGPGRGWVQGQPRHQVPVEQLEDVVGSIVRQTERHRRAGPAGGVEPAPLFLEFVLPFELLNLPVEWWPHGSDGALQVTLASEFSVVIRSLDRLQNREWHEFWNTRWQQLGADEPPSRSVCYAGDTRSRAGVPHALEQRLDDEHLVALVLSEPPLTGVGDGSQELRTALRKGLPVVIWNRADRATTGLREVLDELLGDGLKRFPARVDAYRREAAGHNGDAASPGHIGHIGRHLTVLWDDAERNPMDPDPA
ncbi:hypothetical protein GCM10022403_042850 [Streptomyces coacervatus]|uniref:Uncharacterized protein n=1 Tax=Streptomyces coacervatus TaxID=647381 RepID=A0ABP7HU32_9ACTN|nr:hypothetical protein [Streptomyces coacervatus]MDF2267135.1 hypothetical protein [Streptomyces coacervatus]